MKILGVDPGIGRTGWGVIEYGKSKIKSQKYGCIETSLKKSHEKRLQELYSSIIRIIEQNKPDEIAVEKLFFGSNVTTAFVVGQARGVVMLAASQKNLPVFEYTPLQVKVAVTGYGKAEKAQVGQMVKAILKLDKVPTPDDAADALAVSLTHGFSRRMSLL